MTARMRRQRFSAALGGAAVVAALAFGGAGVHATELPDGFTESEVITGLDRPTDFVESTDGRVFVSEQAGIVKAYDSFSDPTPTTIVDIREQTLLLDQKGLLSIALHPDFTAGQPYLYAAYSVDAPVGGTVPTYDDMCPDDSDGCPAFARVSRFEVLEAETGDEQVLVEDWCQQFLYHAIGDIAFGPDDALYITSGDGADGRVTDYGQFGNPCGDPPTPEDPLAPPTAEGGSLRSQDLRTPEDPTTLSGTIIRVDPETGDPLPDNPLAGPDENARRIVGFGARNPFRVTFRPGTNELWFTDTGQLNFEEINVVDIGADEVPNYGWPCFEGPERQGDFEALGFDLCEQLYDEPGATTQPYFSYPYDAPIPGSSCPQTVAGAVAGLAFAPEGDFPSRYHGGLFFSDFLHSCIWFMPPGEDGRPDPDRLETFATHAFLPISLTFDSRGNLHYIALSTGAIRRIELGQEGPPDPPLPPDAPPAPPEPPAPPAPPSRAPASPDRATLAQLGPPEGGAVCAPVPERPAPTPRTRGELSLSARQLLINQRIYQTVIRRANAIQAWLSAGIQARDVCGGALGLDRFLGSVGFEASDRGTPAAADPRPLEEAPRARGGAPEVTLSRAQALINLRMAQAALRRANALRARIDGQLTGGDIQDAQLTDGQLVPGLGVADPGTQPSPPASRTGIARRRGGEPEAVTLSAAQLAYSQRIGQQAMRRVNAIRANLARGLVAENFMPGSIGGTKVNGSG